MSLSFDQVQQFKIDGYLVLERALSKETCEFLKSLANDHLQRRIEPFELEADLKYPGSPVSSAAAGGETIRRLLLAERRSTQLFDVAQRKQTLQSVQQILGGDEVWLNPNHHNCLMTKQPEHSSETLWHRDTRYWNFDNKYLINAWYALGDELVENGAMKILPGSHRWEVQERALDAEQFLILDHPSNQRRLETARVVTLKQGDALLFSAHCFHAAGKNQTDKTKLSLVFTYHNEHTHPIAGTRSSVLNEIRLPYSNNSTSVESNY